MSDTTIKVYEGDPRRVAPLRNWVRIRPVSSDGTVNMEAVPLYMLGGSATVFRVAGDTGTATPAPPERFTVSNPDPVLWGSYLVYPQMWLCVWNGEAMVPYWEPVIGGEPEPGSGSGGSPLLLPEIGEWLEATSSDGTISRMGCIQVQVDEWFKKIGAAMDRVANEKSWCDGYEKVVKPLGFPVGDRTETWAVAVDVEVRRTVDIRNTSDMLDAAIIIHMFADGEPEGADDWTLNSVSIEAAADTMVTVPVTLHVGQSNERLARDSVSDEDVKNAIESWQPGDRLADWTALSAERTGGVS